MAKLDLNVDVDVKGADKLSSLGSSLGGIARTVGTAGLAATGALAGVAAFTSNFASDMNESLSKVDVVFGDLGDSIVNWSDDAATSFGISQQAALESVSTFGNLFSAMQIGPEANREMSTSLVELASDLASFNNMDPTEVLEKLRAGVVGEAEPLRTLGINISAARTEAKALELGLWDGEGALSAAAKAQANYAVILEDSTLAQGDFARTSDGMANQQRTLAATFQDTMADIGQAFVPIIEAILPQVTAGLQAFGAWVSDNGPAIGGVLSAVASGIGTAFSVLTTVIIPAIISGFQFFSQNILPGLVAAFAVVSEWVRANWPTISSIIQQAIGAVAAALKVVIPIIVNVANVVLPALATAAGVLLAAMDVAFKGIGAVVEALAPIVEAVVGTITGIWEGFMDIFRNAVKTFAGIGKRIFEPLGEGFDAAIGVIKGIWNAFARWWNSIEIAVPSIDIPFVGKVGGFSIGLPDLPMLAEGGIVNSPTLALIGERGPEAVVPLDRAGGMGTEVNVTVMGNLKADDEDSLADAIGRVLWVNGLTDRVLTGTY